MAIGKHLKSLVERMRPAEQPPSPWRPLGAPYPLLSTFDPIAAAIAVGPGVLAIWHLGVRPQWLKIAAVSNLQAAIGSATQTESILFFRPNGGVYLAWALCPAPGLIGNAGFLIEKLKPALQAARLSCELDMPAEVKPLEFPLPPGTVA